MLSFQGTPNKFIKTHIRIIYIYMYIILFLWGEEVPGTPLFFQDHRELPSFVGGWVGGVRGAPEPSEAQQAERLGPLRGARQGADDAAKAHHLSEL